MKRELKEIITDIEELDKLGRAEEIDIIKDNKEMRKIVSEIKSVMRAKNLTSLSAPGIGYNKRIFCIDFSDREIKTFINPLIVNSEGIELSREICSSLPGKEFIRPRNKTVDVIYQTPKGQIKNNRFSGLASMVIQHEIDHLECVNLSDIGLEIDSDFDEASNEDREEIINMYLDSFDMAIDDIIDKDENSDELKKSYEAEKFVEALTKGKIKLEAIQGIPDDKSEEDE